MSIFARALARMSLVPRDITIEDSALAPSQVRYGLKLSIAEGALAQVFITLTAGAFLTGFLLMLGADNTTLGIVSALPFLIQPVQFVGAHLISALGRRKPIAVIGSMGRALWLVPLLLPYLPLSSGQRLVLLVVSLFAASALVTVCGNAWLDWMTDLVPPRLRGRFFSTRNTGMAAMAMLVNAGGGWWLDRMRGLNREADGYAVLLGLGVLCGAVCTMLLGRQPEPPMSAPKLKLAPLAVLRAPWRNRTFRGFLITMIAWNAALAVPAAFFSAHALTVLGLPFTTLASFDVLTSAVAMLTLPMWGRLSDRWGQRRVLVICMAGTIVLPLAWVIATPETLWALYINSTLAGIWWAGIGLTQANRLMEHMPSEARGAYLAAFGAFTGLAYFGASSLGGVLADILARMPLVVAGQTLGPYTLIFVLGSLLRGAVVLCGRRAL